MKTIAVLAALAAVATAVPTLPGYNYEYRSGQDRLPVPIRREKKSPQLLTSDNIPTMEMQDFDADAPEDAARTIVLKKPIIIKKKFGYHHLYRDSDEEMAARSDSNEECSKQVKVKLCESESLAPKRNADEDTDTPLTENEMKHSIKMAKEAVENLQKITNSQKNAASETEFHEDIEIARQALEHIQKNFGNLESMNLQATTLSEAEALQGARFKVAKTNDEKMAQWKEAMENIQKNAEIAKNIEDSFKEARNIPVKLEHVQSKPIMKEVVSEMMPAASELKETIVSLDDATINAKEATLKLDGAKLENNESEKEAVSLHTQENSLKENLAFHEDSVKPVVLAKHSKASDNIENKLTMAPSALALKSELLTNTDGKEKNAWMENHDKNFVAKSNDNESNMENKKDAAIDTTLLMKHSVQGLEQNVHKDVPLPRLTENEHAIFSQVKSAKLEDNIDQQVMSVRPPFIKSAEHNDIVSEVKSPFQAIDHNPDSAHKSELKSSNWEEDKKNEHVALPPFLKSADHQSITLDEKEPAQTSHQKVDEMNFSELKASEVEKSEIPLSFKSVDHQNLKAPTQAIENHEDLTHKVELKSVEHQESASSFKPVLMDIHQQSDLAQRSELKTASTEDNHVQQASFPPFIKSVEEKSAAPQDMKHSPSEVNLKTITLSSQKNTPDLLTPFSATGKSVDHQIPTGSEKLLQSDHQFKESNLDVETEGKDWHEDKMISKTDTMKDVETERNAHVGIQSPHQGFVPHMGAPMHHVGQHGHLIPHHHNHMIQHSPMSGKTVEIDSATAPSTLVDTVAGKSVMEPGKEVARGAYGPSAFGGAAAAAAAAEASGLSLAAGAGSGPGALGVFPGARVGGCAIPLLLSCSPTVVSGRLAKAPAYSAPHAYRSISDFSDRFHNKRDINNAKKLEITTKVKRTPTKLIQKIPLGKKQ